MTDDVLKNLKYVADLMAHPRWFGLSIPLFVASLGLLIGSLYYMPQKGEILLGACLITFLSSVTAYLIETRKRRQIIGLLISRYLDSANRIFEKRLDAMSKGQGMSETDPENLLALLDGVYSNSRRSHTDDSSSAPAGNNNNRS